MPHALCVLLVDDDPLALLIAETCAKAAGLTVVSADDGAEALRLVRQGLRPDLVMTDFEMPGLDGAGLVDALKQLQGHRPLITIMYSGAPRPNRNGGADLWMSKGDPAQLETAFREFAATA